MKKFVVILFLMFFTKSVAQIHEIGLFLGGSNYIGEIGSTKYVNPNQPAIGFLYKWNKSTRHSYRFSIMQSTIKGDDANADSGGRTQRGYNFSNSITEFSAGLEFNFFDFNLHNFDKQLTPYVSTGLSYFIFDQKYFISGDAKNDYRDAALAIPIIVGIKTNVTTNLVLAAEVGTRFTYTDNLDGSNPSNNNLSALRFGNLNSNDWYVFSGFTLTYTFGEKPCYCAD